MVVAVVLVALMAGALLGLVVLTAAGARRRGRAVLPATVAGLLFPITWVAWYVVDRDAPRAS